MAKSPSLEDKVQIQLGDIIEIQAPTDSSLNGKQFFISYASSTLIKLIGENSDQEVELPITDTGEFRNEAITEIDLLSRAESPSYSIQNGLVPGAWVDIYFDGDVPTVVTGKISNLEEDMIELTLLDSGDNIYIDFGYKGIPLDLPIEKIVHRPPPTTLASDTPMVVDIPADAVVETSPGEEEELPIPEVKEQIREMIFQADQIKIGEQLDVIVQEVAVPENQQRFGIEKQTTDMLDEMLSSIPNVERTRSVLNAIHTEIERYKQLRTEFSVFDARGNALMPAVQGADFKPLVKSLQSLDQKLFWLLPVVRDTKKLYDVDPDALGDVGDVDSLTLAETRIEEDRVVANYIENEVPDGENNYAYLVRALRPFLTPFNLPTQPELSIANLNVKAPMTGVVNNLDDFYCSVAHNDAVMRRRFYLQNYVLGDTTLESQRISSGDVVVKPKPLTSSDAMSISSLLFLPESTFMFSSINLPSTSIMTRADLNLNFLQYWAFLNQLTVPTTYTVDDLARPIEHDPKTFMKGIVEYAPDASIIAMENRDKYREFLEAVIPKTRVLFGLIKPYLKGKLSLHEAVSALQPFMVYHRDISFKQYEEIIAYIDEKVGEYKKHYARKSRELASLARAKTRGITPRLLGLLDKDPGLRESVIEGYGLSDLPLDNMTDGELIRIINAIDYGELMDAALALASTHLMVSGGLDRLADLDKWSQDRKAAAEESSACTSLVLAKKYLAVDELEEDDNKELFFDKQFDKTYYGLLDEYRSDMEAQLARVPPDSDMRQSSIKILAVLLANAIGLSPDSARRDAMAMIDGRRIVEDGDYAVLVDGDSESGFRYYMRQGGLWVIDMNITAQAFGDDDKLFCNLNEKCFAIKDECLDLRAAKAEVATNNVSQILNEFDSDLAQGASEIAASTEASVQSALTRITSLRIMVESQALRYDRVRAVIGMEADNMEVTGSPREPLRDLILGQADLAKRQVDIARFVAYYTRTANDGEDRYWLYCIDTAFKLLPTFVARLSVVFNERGNYIQALADICKDQGTISDDGDSWVDKHSGYTIMAIGFNSEEETFGASAVGRDVLEIDLGESIMKGGPPPQEYQSIEAEKVANVVRAMTGFLGIDLSESLSFIMRATISSLARSMPAREAYQKATDAADRMGKKKMDSFETAYDASLLIITLCYILIAIQTSTPSLITRKTHPGCKRGSLFKNTGFPLDGGEDKSGLIYIACVANKIKSSVEPWNAIRRTSESGIAKKMEATLSKIILKTGEVQERIKEKLTYLTQVETGVVPVEHDMRRWINFLPVLVPVKVQGLTNVSREFTDSLAQNLQRGSQVQFEKIDVMRSKIIFYALAIQEAIQGVVSKGSAILSNSVGEPFLENSCCDDGTTNTYRYFTTKEPKIAQYNDIVANLSNVLDDLGAMARAAILFDPADTKFRYPKLSPEFSEETIYRAFIVYCKYNSNLPISEPLRALCMGKPASFDAQDSIDQKIKNLKAEGRMYSIESLNELMSIVNRQNLVHLDLQRPVWSNIQATLDVLEAAEMEDSEAVPARFRSALVEALDSISQAPSRLPVLTEDTPKIRTLKNYLDTTTTRMSVELRSFVSQNASTQLSRSFAASLDRLHAFTAANNEPIRMVNFMRRTIRQISRVLPSIVLNEGDYTNIPVPRHWKLSERHTSDIKEFVRRYYAPLAEFYGDPEIAGAIERVILSVRPLQALSELTYFELPLRQGETVYFSIFGERMCSLLFRFYFTSVLFEYMRVIEDMDAIVRTVARPVQMSTEDVVTSVQLAEADTGNITEVEIVAGERLVMAQKLNGLVTALVKMTCSDQGDLGAIDYSYEGLMERLLRSKEKEKDNITSYLKEMSDEEREVENLFKNHKLGMWGVGQQKGFRTYQADTYDAEREAMEKQALVELRMGQSNLVTDMNRDIFAMDAIAEQADAERIEAEAMDIGMYVGEEDDHGDMDGDEMY